MSVSAFKRKNFLVFILFPPPAAGETQGFIQSDEKFIYKKLNLPELGEVFRTVMRNLH